MSQDSIFEKQGLHLLLLLVLFTGVGLISGTEGLLDGSRLASKSDLGFEGGPGVGRVLPPLHLGALLLYRAAGHA